MLSEVQPVYWPGCENPGFYFTWLDVNKHFVYLKTNSVKIRLVHLLPFWDFGNSDRYSSRTRNIVRANLWISYAVVSSTVELLCSRCWHKIWSWFSCHSISFRKKDIPWIDMTSTSYLLSSSTAVVRITTIKLPKSPDLSNLSIVTYLKIQFLLD